MPRYLLLFFILLSGFVLTARAGDPADNLGRGLLAVRTVSPGHVLRPTVVRTDFPQTEAGTRRAGIHVEGGNTWNLQTNAFLVDSEWYSLEARVSWTPVDNLSISAILPFSLRTGGFMDNPIETFHEVLGLGDDGRKSFPTDDVRVVFTEQNGDGGYRRTSDSFGINDIPVLLSTRLTPGGDVLPAVAIHGGVVLPTGDEDQLEGLGAAQVVAGALLSKRLGASPWFGLLGGGIAYADVDTIANIRVRNRTWHLVGGLEYAWTDDLSLVGQYLYNSPVAKSYYDLADPVHLLHAGFKWAPGTEWEISCAIIENLINYENSTDFGLSLSATRTF